MIEGILNFVASTLHCVTIQSFTFIAIGMAGKQAKVLFDHHVQALLAYATASRYPIRNRVIVLLSVKAGLRAGEIANLTWPMVVDPSGEIATAIELRDGAAKV